jgi:hypothetical protein
MDWGEVGRSGLVGALFGGIAMILVGRARRVSVERAPVPGPRLDHPSLPSTSVLATMAALRTQTAPGGTASWLVAEFGGERPAVEALVGCLQLGPPEEGPFTVNRLVGRTPVRLAGEVRNAVAVISSVNRLDSAVAE